MSYIWILMCYHLSIISLKKCISDKQNNWRYIRSLVPTAFIILTGVKYEIRKNWYNETWLKLAPVRKRRNYVFATWATDRRRHTCLRVDALHSTRANNYNTFLPLGMFKISSPSPFIQLFHVSLPLIVISHRPHCDLHKSWTTTTTTTRSVRKTLLINS